MFVFSSTPSGSKISPSDTTGRIARAVTGQHQVVVRFSAMGDVALTTGVLHYWHQTKGITFTVLTKAALVPLFAHHPAVTHVIGLEERDLHGERQRSIFRQLAQDWRGFPLLDLHGSTRTRLLSLFWKGPVRRYPKLALARRFFLWSHGALCKNTLLRHNVSQRYSLALPQDEANFVPAPHDLLPRFFLTDEERAHARECLAPLILSPSLIPGTTPSPGALLGLSAGLLAGTESSAPSAPILAPALIALHPYATHEAKTWPMAFWRDLAARLEARGMRYFWVGQGKDKPGGPADFVNQTDLRSLLALLAEADVLISGDSGPMHLAEGVGTPVLALFGPTCREWGFFPSGPASCVLQAPMPCRPCSLHGKMGKRCSQQCMLGLEPAKIEAALLTMLTG